MSLDGLVGPGLWNCERPGEAAGALTVEDPREVFCGAQTLPRVVLVRVLAKVEMG